MKIAIVTDNYYPHVSGSSVFSRRLASHLKKRGHHTLIIAPSKTKYTEFYNYNGIDVYGIGSFSTSIYEDYRIAIPFFLKRKIKKIMAEFKPDIVHIQNHFLIGRATLTIAKELKIPTIVTNSFMPENFIHYLYVPKILKPCLQKFLWRQCNKIFEKADIIETPTNSAANLIRKIGFSKPIWIISHGVDLRRFNPKNDGSYLKKRYKLPNKPILLYVGRIDREKCIDVILKAMPSILKKINIHLVIAGRGSEFNNLKKLAQKLSIENNVTFTGLVPDEDLPNLYRVADCFVIASIAELQSFVTMEAMASGLPVIAADAIALPELVHHGENGCLFKPGDIRSLAECVVHIFYKKLLKKMSKGSLEIIKKHDVKTTINKFEELYKSLIQGQ